MRWSSRPRESQQGPELRLELVAISPDAPVSHANDPDPVRLEPCVSAPIGLEGVAVAAKLPAVELHDEALGAPQAVDDEIAERSVHLRDWQAMGVAEADEAALEAWICGSEGEALVAEEPSKNPRAATRAGRAQARRKGGSVEKSFRVGGGS